MRPVSPTEARQAIGPHRAFPGQFLALVSIMTAMSNLPVEGRVDPGPEWAATATLPPEITARLLADVDIIARRITRRIAGEIALPAQFHTIGYLRTVTGACRDALRTLVRLLRDGRGLRTADLQRLGSMGAQQAEMGVPLEVLLAAYRLAARVVWRELIGEAAGLDSLPRATVIGVTGQVLEYLDEISGAVGAAYLDTRERLMRRRALGRDRILQRLVAGDASPELRRLAAASDLDLRPPYLVLACAAASDEEERALEPVLRLLPDRHPGDHGGRAGAPRPRGQGHHRAADLRGIPVLPGPAVRRRRWLPDHLRAQRLPHQHRRLRRGRHPRPGLERVVAVRRHGTGPQQPLCLHVARLPPPEADGDGDGGRVHRHGGPAGGQRQRALAAPGAPRGPRLPPQRSCQPADPARRGHRRRLPALRDHLLRRPAPPPAGPRHHSRSSVRGRALRGADPAVPPLLPGCLAQPAVGTDLRLHLPAALLLPDDRRDHHARGCAQRRAGAAP